MTFGDGDDPVRESSSKDMYFNKTPKNQYTEITLQRSPFSQKGQTTANAAKSQSYSELRASETPPMPTSDRTTGPLSDDDDRRAYLELYAKS